jgi:hypothetical protein
MSKFEIDREPADIYIPSSQVNAAGFNCQQEAFCHVAWRPDHTSSGQSSAVQQVYSLPQNLKVLETVSLV